MHSLLSSIGSDWLPMVWQGHCKSILSPPEHKTLFFHDKKQKHINICLEIDQIRDLRLRWITISSMTRVKRTHMVLKWNETSDIMGISRVLGWVTYGCMLIFGGRTYQLPVLIRFACLYAGFGWFPQLRMFIIINQHTLGKVSICPWHASQQKTEELLRSYARLVDGQTARAYVFFGHKKLLPAIEGSKIVSSCVGISWYHRFRLETSRLSVTSRFGVDKMIT